MTAGTPLPRPLRAFALIPLLRPRTGDGSPTPVTRRSGAAAPLRPQQRSVLPSGDTPGEPRRANATDGRSRASRSLALPSLLRLRDRRDDSSTPDARTATPAARRPPRRGTPVSIGPATTPGSGGKPRTPGPTATEAPAAPALPTPDTHRSGAAVRPRRAIVPAGSHDHPLRRGTEGGGGSGRLRGPLGRPERAGQAGAAGPRPAGRARGPHAGAWWLWALGLSTAASRTTNPALLALLAAVAGYVVAVCRVPDTPWSRSYAAFLRLGLVVVAIRLVFAVVLGSPIPGTHTVLTLPEVPLPDWAQGVRLGGRVTAEGLWFAFREGMRLATLLACLGAANALANPARLLKSLPGVLYEAGVAVVVAMTFAPHLVADVRRLRTARRLRGRAEKGVRALLQVGLPVLEGALERSVALAAAMDARGYGRTAAVPPAVRRATVALTLGGLLGLCAGTYALLAATGAAYGLPLLLAGLAAAVAGLRLGGRRSVRTRYRPDRWDATAWLITASGAAVAALTIWAAVASPPAWTRPSCR